MKIKDRKTYENEEVCDEQKILAHCSQTRIHLDIGFWTFYGWRRLSSKL